MKKKIKKKYKIIIYAFFLIVCLCYIIPLMVVVSASFSDETTLAMNISNTEGFGILPKQFTLAAYAKAFSNSGSVFRAYAVTAAQAFLGTFLACVVAGMMAFALSREHFRFRKLITFYVFFTMLFNGGIIPTYIIYTRYYGLGNSFWVYVLPGIAGGAGTTLMIRTFFKALPASLFESARMDGASEMVLFFRFAVPLSKPIMATVAFSMVVGKWNDWNTSLLYIRDANLYTLQYLLQKVLNEIEFIKALSNDPLRIVNLDFAKLTQPKESLKYALCVIAAGPMLVVFPLFQQYFSTGLTAGAIKE